VLVAYFELIVSYKKKKKRDKYHNWIVGPSYLIDSNFPIFLLVYIDAYKKIWEVRGDLGNEILVTFSV